MTVGGTSSSDVPPSVVTSDQPFFDPRTSISGLSSGVTVGGTGSSLVQTTGEAAQRVHLPEVAVTIETLISPVQSSPVQATGRVSSQPVMRDTGTSSAQTAGCGHTEIQQGLPVKQDYRLQRVAGDTQQGYRLQRITGYRETCYSHHYWQEGSYSEQV